MKIANADNKWGYGFLLMFMSLSLLWMAPGCGGGDSSSSASINDGDASGNQPGGGIAFRGNWGGPERNPKARAAPLDCEGAGVYEVTAEVYGHETEYPDSGEPEPAIDGSEVLLASGGPWECSAHSATIENVPPGAERRIVVKGLDTEGNTLYQGEAHGLAVEVGSVTDAGLIEAFAMLTVDFNYLQYRTYSDSARNRYRADIEMSVAGRPISPKDVRKIVLKDEQGNVVPTQAPRFFREDFYPGVSASGGDVQFGDIGEYSSYMIDFPPETALPAGDYTCEVTAASGQVLTQTLYYPGRADAPTLISEFMSHEWLPAGALFLSWRNPEADYDGINVYLADENWHDMAYIELPPEAEDAVIPVEEIRKLENMENPISAKWIVRFRNYTETGMNYARGYSDTVDIPWNNVTIDFIDYFPLAIGNSRTKTSSFGDTWKEEIAGRESIHGVDAYQQAYYDEDFANMTEIDDLDLFSYDSAYFYLHGTRQVGDPSWNEDPLGLYRHDPPLEFDRYMSVGDTRTSATTISRPDGTLASRTFTAEFLGFEDANTPYGFFPNCAKMRYIDEIEGQTPTEDYEWHAKGVGGVKGEAFLFEEFDGADQLINAEIIGNVDNLSIPWPPHFQYRVFADSTRNGFWGFLEVRKNGIGANQEDIVDIKVRKSDYTEVPIDKLTYYDSFSYGASWNESRSEFDFWGPRYDKNWGVTFAEGTEPEADYYIWEVVATNNKVATHNFYFPGKRELPIHDSTLMNYEWLTDGGLSLRWVNPAGDYDRIQIGLWTQDGRDVFYSTFDREYDIEEIVIPADSIADARSKIDNFTSIQWTMRTRARTAEGVNYARGYSDVVDIPFQNATRVDLCVQDYKLPSPEFVIDMASCESSGGASLNTNTSQWIRMSKAGYATESDALSEQIYVSLTVLLDGDPLPQDGETLVQFNDATGTWEISSYHCTGYLSAGTHSLTGSSTYFDEPYETKTCQLTVTSK